MTRAVRYAFLALPVGLCLAGCSGHNRAESRPPSAAGGRTNGSVSGYSPRPATGSDEVLGYVAPSAPRYDITLDEIREHVRNQTALIIDVRGAGDFAEGHVRGAFNMQASQREAYMGQLSQRAARDQFIIIYCNGPRCDSADMVYEYLESQGFTNMRVFKPGWAALASAKDLR